MVILAGSGALAPAASLDREQQIALLNEAVQLYDDGSQIQKENPRAAERHYLDAAGKFQALVDAGVVNAKLYYNLGNVHLRIGHIGTAILNYRRAQLLDVGDAQLQKNLDFARSLCRTQIKPPGQNQLWQRLFFWHYGSSLGTRARLALASYTGFWGLLILCIFARSWYWRGLCWICFVGCASLGISAGIETYQSTRVFDGVILRDDVVARKGNGEGFEPQFVEQLHQGVEFTLVESRGSWYQIRLADGKSGWIPAAAAELI
jgi:tetratricopeptide (TPR) repeat protein